MRDAGKLVRVNAYALKWRGNGPAAPLCAEMAPPSPETWRWRRGCGRPAYHAGLHRIAGKSGHWVWGSGDRAVRLARGRRPSKPAPGCSTVPGAYCKKHKVRHYRPRRHGER